MPKLRFPLSKEDLHLLRLRGYDTIHTILLIVSYSNRVVAVPRAVLSTRLIAERRLCRRADD